MFTVLALGVFLEFWLAGILSETSSVDPPEIYPRTHTEILPEINHGIAPGTPLIIQVFQLKEPQLKTIEEPLEESREIC